MSRHNRERRQRRKDYLESILEHHAAGTLQPGSVYTVDVLHDSWCDLLTGKGPCNCDPEVRSPVPVSFFQEN